MPRFQTGHGYIRSLLICIVLSTGSCSRSGHNDHAGYTVEMLNGVRLQRFAVSHQAQLNPFTIEKAVTYGTDQGADTYLLSRPFPTGIDGDGILYVMDLMTAVHRFGPDGTHLGQFYQRGQGPGEFTMLQDLVVDDPYLYSADLILNRMNVFDPDGTWLRSITIPADAERSPYWSIWGPPSERRFMVWHFHADRPTSDDAVTMHTGYRLNLLDPHFQIIATPMDTSWSQDIIQIDGRSYSIPFTIQRPQVALAPDLPVAWSWGKEFRVDFYDVRTGDRWATLIPVDPVPVTSAMKEWYFEHIREPDRAAQVRRHIRFPEHAALIENTPLHWDRSGRLWIREFTDPTITGAPDRYQVFSRNGLWLFTQDLPSGVWLITAERVYCRDSLEDGTPVIQAWDFRSVEGG